MKDTISQSRLLTLHPKVRADFQSFIEEAEKGLDIKLRITSALRSFAIQEELYAQGRTKAGKIVTKAKPGSSFHNYGLAVDLVRMDGSNVDWNYDLSKLLPYADKYDIDWGGSWSKFKDYPHFEKTLGNSWKSLLAKYNSKKFIPGTNYLAL